MVVTNIERQKRRPKRVNVYIDGEFAVGLHEDVLFKFGLRKGDNVDRETLVSIESAEESHFAKEKALRFIGYRSRSEKELRSKLREKQFHPQVIEDTVRYLRENRFLDDEAFARSFVKDALLRKPTGRLLLRRQLRLKGIDTGIIEEVLDELVPQHDEDTLAIEAASTLLKRFRASRKKIDREKQRARLASLLARRGFGWPTIHAVLRRVLKPGAQTSDEDEGVNR
ncbi:MAG: RecX family transcriptional regulator [Bacteroidota bacterium]|jgi:regulatory protein